MSNLIILVVSVILLGIMGAITMDYLGSGVTDSSKNADASGLISQAQQIASAVRMDTVQELTAAASLDELKTRRYLTATPVSPLGTWGMVAGSHVFVTSGNISDDTCDRVNTVANKSFDVTAAAATDGSLGDIAAAADAADTNLFECDKANNDVGVATADVNTFIFRL